ncbi:MAG: HNH endonuclease [Candidatus Xenobiia bacterium LiM19]
MTFFRDACGTGQGSKDSLCACNTGQGSIDVLCAPLEIAPPASKSGANLLCASFETASSPAEYGVAASLQEITCKDGNFSGGACSHDTGTGANGNSANCHDANNRDSNNSRNSDSSRFSRSDGCDNIVNSTVHAEETMAKVREICTMPHGADPAETFLMDILEGDSGSRLNTTHRLKCRMSIKFFLPEELFDLWNTVFTAYLQQSVAEGTMLRRVNDVEDIYRSPLDYADSAESFLAALLQGWLLTEKAHLRFSRDYAILKRDRFRCQVPGCNCRRNLHVHHIIWRSKGGTDDPANLIVLCTKCHLRLLHNLLTLKIEGTAPHNLTFTFGPRSHGDEWPFLKYVRGRKVLKAT